MSLPIRLCLVLFPFFYGFLAISFGQDANWDLKNYHWYNAYAFLNGRYGFDLLPSQTPYFYNPVLDLPLYLLGTTLGGYGTAFVLGTVQGLNFVLLFTLARRVMTPAAARDRYALLIAFIGMIGGGVLGELGTSFYDNIVSLGVLAGMSVIVLRLQQGDRERGIEHESAVPPSSRHPVSSYKWFITGIPFGLVTGFKLPTAVFAFGCSLALVLYPASFTERMRRGFFCALGMAFGLAIAMGPWAWYLYSEFGNPLFPYFNDFFQSPFAPFTSARDMQFLPQGWEKLYFPFLYTLDQLQVGEVPWRDIKFPLTYLLLPVALLLYVFQNRAHYHSGNILTNRRAVYVLLAGGISYLAWLNMFAIYRYAIPLEMMAGLMLFCTIDLFRLHAQRKQMIFSGLAILALGTMQVADWGRVPIGEKYINATVPAIEEPANAMLLMAGFQPYSHIIPHFPPEMPVVRIQSNFASPEENKGINPILRARVKNHTGRFYILLPVYDVEWISKKVLPQFGLKTLAEKCQTVTNSISEDLSLCPVIHSK